MDVLMFLFHIAMMFGGATIPLEIIKYPKTLMLINRLALIVLIIYLML